MKSRNGTQLLGLGAGICFVAAAACAATTQDRGLEAAAKKVSELALSGDAKGVEAFVGQNGVTCGDSVIGRKEVLHDLGDSSSWLHSYLFNASHSKQHGTSLSPTGLREYLQKAKGLELIATRTGDTYGCVRYKSANSELWPELCFFKEGDRWVFTDGPYACP